MINQPLKIFVTVVEHKNFSRAADELYLSQSSVSLQIQNLENELGTKLIHRSPKRSQRIECKRTDGDPDKRKAVNPFFLDNRIKKP